MVFADVVEVDGESEDDDSLVEGFDVGLSVNAGLSLATDTTSSRSLICNVKCLSVRLRTLYGPSYGCCRVYNSVDDTLPMWDRHKMWLHKIRQAVCNRIMNEEDRVATYTSLWCHWLRSSWIHQMWQRSICRDVYSTLPQPEQSGWIKDGIDYAIDWE